MIFGMKLISLLFILFLFFAALFAFAVDAPPVYIGKATSDCKCHTTMFDEYAVSYTVKKDMGIGEICSASTDKKDSISCTNGHFGSIHCPKSCVQLFVQKALTKDNYVTNVKKVENGARAHYAKMVPPNVYQELQKKYPAWLPVLINQAGDKAYVAKFELGQDFYFHFPLKVEGKESEVSLIYFYKGMNELLSNSVSWSFWNTKSGELIYESLAPYKSQEGSYVDQPCLVPFGDDLKQVVLYGVMAGPGDAAGCCGPYSLQDLKKSGPVMLSKFQGSEIVDNVTYRLCGKSTDKKTGEFSRTLSLALIDGPANIRASHSLNAKVVGSCADRAWVADLGSDGKWNQVFCEGKLGWTFKANIRPKN